MGAKMTLHEPKDSPTLMKAAGLCREKIGEPGPAELDRGLDGFLARIDPAQARPRRLLRWSLAAAALASSTLIALRFTSVVPSRTPVPATLSYRVEGGTMLEGGYLRESGHAGMNVVFSEGSHV